jgi:hypothetical protein
MKLNLEKNEEKELREDFYDLFKSWFERVSPELSEEPSVSLTYDGRGLYVAITEEMKYWAEVPWDKFEADILFQENEIIKMYIPKFKKLVLKMEKELEDGK